MIKKITEGIYETLEVRTDEDRIAIRQKQRTRIGEDWNIKVTILNKREALGVFEAISDAVLQGKR